MDGHGKEQGVEMEHGLGVVIAFRSMDLIDMLKLMDGPIAK